MSSILISNLNTRLLNEISNWENPLPSIKEDDYFSIVPFNQTTTRLNSYLTSVKEALLTLGSINYIPNHGSSNNIQVGQAGFTGITIDNSVYDDTYPSLQLFVKNDKGYITFATEANQSQNGQNYNYASGFIFNKDGSILLNRSNFVMDNNSHQPFLKINTVPTYVLRWDHDLAYVRTSVDGEDPGYDLLQYGTDSSTKRLQFTFKNSAGVIKHRLKTLANDEIDNNGFTGYQILYQNLDHDTQNNLDTNKVFWWLRSDLCMDKNHKDKRWLTRYTYDSKTKKGFNAANLSEPYVYAITGVSLLPYYKGNRAGGLDLGSFEHRWKRMWSWRSYVSEGIFPMKSGSNPTYCGSSEHRWDNIYTKNLDVSGKINFKGALSANQIETGGDLKPKVDNKYSLGTSKYTWKAINTSSLTYVVKGKNKKVKKGKFLVSPTDNYTKKETVKLYDGKDEAINGFTTATIAASGDYSIKYQIVGTAPNNQNMKKTKCGDKKFTDKDIIQTTHTGSTTKNGKKKTRKITANEVKEKIPVEWYKTLSVKLTLPPHSGTLARTQYVKDQLAKKSSSDIRLKTNIEPTEVNGLEFINNINLYQFDWIETEKHCDVGLIADELEKLDNKLVDKVPDAETEEEYKSVNTYYLLNYALKAIQELSAENKKLAEKIKILEEKI